MHIYRKLLIASAALLWGAVVFGQPVMITNQPQSQTVTAGANVTFSVGATGLGPLAYEWQFNGTNLNPTGGIITTVAGGGAGGDGGLATNASLSSPRGVAVDAAGNVFIADQQDNIIRQVSLNGIITTVAGNRSGSFGGDGGPAINAGLQFPFGVAVDATGNLFIADFYDQRIRKVDTNGIITTVAGSGPTGPSAGAYAGDGGAATSARLNLPTAVAVDASDNLFIADYGNNRIRKVGTNGIITTVAGNGTAVFSGDGGAATNAGFAGLNGVGVDTVGNIYIGDTSGFRVRKVNLAGIITTIAGGGTNSPGDGGAATNAALAAPTGVVADAFGNVFIADANGNRIREVGSNGIITTVAGNGAASFSGDGGIATNASLSYPYELTLDGFGNIFIVDLGNDRIRKVTLNNGSILTLNNVTSNNAGNYTVLVSNPFQSVTSSVAVLTVTPPVCTPAPAGLVGWWQGEGNAADTLGLNSGTLVGGVTFAPGKVGEAFNLNGTSQYVDVPDAPSLNPTTGITCEAWVNPAQLTSGAPPIIKKAGIGGSANQANGYALELQGSLGADFRVYVNGNWYHAQYAPVLVGQWSHLAGVYDGVNVSLYLNGVLAASTAVAGTIASSPNDLQIGHDPSNPTRYFPGLIDEASVYSRALSSNEIQTIYLASTAGKCSGFPPTFTSQPQSETLYAGRTASFSAGAGGEQPLSYQWFVNNASISALSNPTATNATLVLASISAGQSGNMYSVRVTNSLGLTNSAGAMLTVLSPGSCYPAPAGIISWWPGEFNGMDIAGTNNGTLVGGVTFSNGIVGEAFSFNGVNQYVDVPDAPALNPTAAVTCEAWINPASFAGIPPIIKKDGVISGGYALELGGSQGALFGVYVNGNWNIAQYAPVPLNQWSHVAGVYDGTNISLYLNGVLAASTALSGAIVTAASDLHIGHDPANPSRYFNGLIDEPSVYNRALSPVEIQDIYDASRTGKCSEPEIAMQPISQVGYLAGSATLSVGVFGPGPFTYQWNFNGAPIANATNATLTLGNLQPGNGGMYTVTVGNQYGSQTSAPATLIVTPATISIALYAGIDITGVPGLTYGVQYSTNLNNLTGWLGLANVTLSQTNELYFDLEPATQQRRYYRVLPGPISIP